MPVVFDSSNVSAFEDSSVDISVLDAWLVTDVLGSSKDKTLDVDWWLVFPSLNLSYIKKNNVQIVTTLHLIFVVNFST